MVLTVYVTYLTKLLGTSDFGKVSLYSTWLAIFSILIALDLNAAVVKGKYGFGKRYKSYLSSVLFPRTLGKISTI